MSVRGPSAWEAAQHLAAALLVAFLLLPVAALVFTLHWSDFVGGLRKAAHADQHQEDRETGDPSCSPQ